MIKLNWSPCDGAWIQYDWCLLEEKGTPDIICREQAMPGHSWKVGICSPGERPQWGVEVACTDFGPSSLQNCKEIHFCCFKPSCLWHFFVASLQTNAVTLEDSLADSYKTKHPLIIQISNCTPSYLPKWIEKCKSTQSLRCLMFIAALFTNAKTWRHPRSFSVVEWINRGTSGQWNVI